MIPARSLRSSPPGGTRRERTPPSVPEPHPVPAPRIPRANGQEPTPPREPQVHARAGATVCQAGVVARLVSCVLDTKGHDEVTAVEQPCHMCLCSPGLLLQQVA